MINSNDYRVTRIFGGTIDFAEIIDGVALLLAQPSRNETSSNQNGSKVLRTLAKDSSEDCRSWICKYYDLKQIHGHYGVGTDGFGPTLR